MFDDIEELLRKADFSRHATAHKEALRKRLFQEKRKERTARELTDEDLEYVTAASKTWIEQEEKLK